MDYVLDNKTYSVSYKELKELYNKFSDMTDSEFLSKLPEAIHFACIVSFFKESTNIQTVSDVGIIHELAHLLHLGDKNTTPLSEIRELFNLLLYLS